MMNEKLLTIDLAYLVRYAGASGDFNSLHFDADVARARGFSNCVAHGMFMMGLVYSAIAELYPNNRLSNVSVRFQAPTLVGETIVIYGKMQNDFEGSIEIKNTLNEVKLVLTFEIKQ